MGGDAEAAHRLLILVFSGLGTAWGSGAGGRGHEPFGELEVVERVGGEHFCDSHVRSIFLYTFAIPIQSRCNPTLIIFFVHLGVEKPICLILKHHRISIHLNKSRVSGHFLTYSFQFSSLFRIRPCLHVLRANLLTTDQLLLQTFTQQVVMGRIIHFLLLLIYIEALLLVQKLLNHQVICVTSRLVWL